MNVFFNLFVHVHYIVLSVTIVYEFDFPSYTVCHSNDLHVYNVLLFLIYLQTPSHMSDIFDTALPIESRYVHTVIYKCLMSLSVYSLSSKYAFIVFHHFAVAISVLCTLAVMVAWIGNSMSSGMWHLYWSDEIIKALYGKQVPSSIHFYAKIKEKWHNVRSTVFNLWLKAMCKWAILTYYSVHLN